MKLTNLFHRNQHQCQHDRYQLPFLCDWCVLKQIHKTNWYGFFYFIFYSFPSSCRRQIVEEKQIEKCSLTDHVFYRCCTVARYKVRIKWYHGNATIFCLKNRVQYHDESISLPLYLLLINFRDKKINKYTTITIKKKMEK